MSIFFQILVKKNFLIMLKKLGSTSRFGAGILIKLGGAISIFRGFRLRNYGLKNLGVNFQI